MKSKTIDIDIAGRVFEPVTPKRKPGPRGKKELPARAQVINRTFNNRGRTETLHDDGTEGLYSELLAEMRKHTQLLAEIRDAQGSTGLRPAHHHRATPRRWRRSCH
jgi:hypothetical protein